METISSGRPDLVFLDIQMPELDGFGVIKSLSSEAMPIVIFVTAHDAFALKAFEAHGLDFLLKPFHEDRFYKALQRARTYFAGQQSGEARKRLTNLAAELPARPKYLSRLMIKSGGGVIFLKTSEIDWIGAAGNYLQLNVGKASYLLRGRLSELEKKLDPELFFRLHRSTIVNLDRVKEFKPLFQGDGTVVLHNGVRLAASRACRQKLEESLGQKL